MGIIIFIASLLGGILPVVSSAVAALICILIYKRHPIMVGAITAELSILGNLLIGIIFFDVISDIQTDADVRMGAMAFIVISFLLGAVIGFIYKILTDRNQKVGLNEGQTSAFSPNKPVWPWWSIFAVSFLFSSGAAYLVTWQALKRIGEKETTKKFLLIGGFILVIMSVMAQLYLAKDNLRIAKYALQIVSIGFPYWYMSYFNNWKTKTGGKTSLDWSLVLWTVAGLILTFGVNLVVITVLSSLGIVK